VNRCPQPELTSAHLASCPHCRQELEALGGALASWPTDVLRPSPTLQQRLAERIAGETGKPVPPPAPSYREPEWDEVCPGIFVKMLAADGESHMVSMLVKLLPNVEYPPHMHAGVEELHLLEGELWIDERKLFPGDYNRGEPGTGDKRVWSETGCTCVLITSAKDPLS
jgi:anti-sigma factor ChrR (cupin superfamily)